MKKLLSSFLLILCGLLFAQEYRPLLLPDNQWIASFFMYDFESGQFEYTDYHYRFNNISHEINGKNYLELEVRSRYRIESTPITSWTNWSTAEFYLAENIGEKKVYVYYTSNTQHEQGEYLLYDFNLEIGDMMDFSGFVEGDFSEPLPVLDITYETVYGLDMVKTYHFEQEWQNPIQVYEGIGSTMGLVQSSFMFDAGWQMTDFGTNLNADDITVKKSKVYPNPYTNQIQIESVKNIKQLQVFDLNGKLIQSKTNLNELNSQLPGLNSGVYILTITYQNNTKESVKLMKK